MLIPPKLTLRRPVRADYLLSTSPAHLDSIGTLWRQISTLTGEIALHLALPVHKQYAIVRSATDGLMYAIRAGVIVHTLAPLCDFCRHQDATICAQIPRWPAHCEICRECAESQRLLLSARLQPLILPTVGPDAVDCQILGAPAC